MRLLFVKATKKRTKNTKATRTPLRPLYLTGRNSIYKTEVRAGGKNLNQNESESDSSSNNTTLPMARSTIKPKPSSELIATKQKRGRPAKTKSAGKRTKES